MGLFPFTRRSLKDGIYNRIMFVDEVKLMGTVINQDVKMPSI